MAELKTCPFCGGKVSMVYNSFDKAFKFYHVNAEYSLTCPIIEPIMIDAVSLADAAECWNRRVNEC